MAAKIKLLKGLLTSVSLASLITSINTESNNVFAAGVAVPHGAMLSNHEGSPNRLNDVVGDKRWTPTDKFGNSVGFNLFINAPANGDALIQPPNDHFTLLANVPGVVLGAYNIQGGNNPQTVLSQVTFQLVLL